MREAIEAVRRTVKELSNFSESGRPIEELPPKFREWVIEFGSGAYVALYHFEGKKT